MSSEPQRNFVQSQRRREHINVSKIRPLKKVEVEMFNQRELKLISTYYLWYLPICGV